MSLQRSEIKSTRAFVKPRPRSTSTTAAVARQHVDPRSRIEHHTAGWYLPQFEIWRRCWRRQPQGVVNLVTVPTVDRGFPSSSARSKSPAARRSGDRASPSAELPGIGDSDSTYRRWRDRVEGERGFPTRQAGNDDQPVARDVPSFLPGRERRGRKSSDGTYQALGFQASGFGKPRKLSVRYRRRSSSRRS